MSKPVKEMIIRHYDGRLEGQTGAAVIGMRGIASNLTNQLRAKLRQKEIRVTVVSNRLAKQSFGEGPLSGLSPVMTGQNAIVYGAESVVEVARELVKILKEFPDVQVKGAILEGRLFEGEAGLTELSKFPTRPEALAQCVTIVVTPARKLVGAVASPGSKAVGVVKVIADKLEKGETVAAVS